MMRELTDILAENVRRRRQELGLSQDDLARRAGISRSALGKIELGKGDPRLRTLELLAKGIGLTEADLFEDREG